MEQQNVPGQETAGKPGRKWVVWVVAALALIMLILAVVIPKFLSYGARARQSEARSGLWAIYKAEQSFFEKHKRYGNFDEIGFKPEQRYRYTFRIDGSGKPGTVLGPTGGAVASTGEPYGVAPDNSVASASLSADGQHFTATATGNIDSDDTVDAWHINDSSGASLINDVDDVRN